LRELVDAELLEDVEWRPTPRQELFPQQNVLLPDRRLGQAPRFDVVEEPPDASAMPGISAR
jgi:hypothetical protein